MIHAVSVFSVKFTVEFTSLAIDFSIEESKENDLSTSIKAATETLKRGQFETFFFPLTAQAVRVNNQGAPLLGLA